MEIVTPYSTGFSRSLVGYCRRKENIGPTYVRGLGWVVTKAKIKSKITQIVEFTVAMMCTCTHKGPTFHYKAYIDVL